MKGFLGSGVTWVISFVIALLAVAALPRVADDAGFFVALSTLVVSVGTHLGSEWTRVSSTLRLQGDAKTFEQFLAALPDTFMYEKVREHEARSFESLNEITPLIKYAVAGTKVSCEFSDAALEKQRKKFVSAAADFCALVYKYLYSTVTNDDPTIQTAKLSEDQVRNSGTAVYSIYADLVRAARRAV